jgi:pyruvate dehydrogenase E2 component (dihydrolipoamide acetyltransferase)
VPTFKQFKLPDLGEGLTEGEILKWLVKPGDEVKLNQNIVEVETAKAAVEVPSPFAGVVKEIHHAEGETVDVGSPIITIDVDPAGSAAAQDTAPPDDDVVGGVVAKAQQASAEEKIEVLVGTGPKAGALRRRARKGVDVVEAPAPAEIHPPARVSAAEVGAHAAKVAGGVTVLAKPPVRKLAKDLGVDLLSITPSGPGGTITREDVLAIGSNGSAAETARPAPAYSRPAPGQLETRIPIKGVRKMMAQAMVDSAFTAPHVTEFMTIDMTASMELLERLRGTREYRDVKLTPLVLVAKALMLAAQRTPAVNATWDEAAQEIVLKHYVNLGIAAATPRGLLVPNVKDAHTLSLRDLATAIGDLAATAREGKTTSADMSGGTITITNVGVFGVDTGTPIINPGEAAILCFGAVREMPWVVNGQVVPRQVTQLALSFDHRMIDGEAGSKFLADVGNLLQDPGLALTW